METIAAAAAAVSLSLPAGDESWVSVGSYFNLNEVDEPGEGYPVASFSYILVYKELNVISGMTREKAKVLVKFLWWIIHGGQFYTSELLYVPLPQEVITHNEATIQMITFDGQKLADWT